MLIDLALKFVLRKLMNFGLNFVKLRHLKTETRIHVKIANLSNVQH